MTDLKEKRELTDIDLFRSYNYSIVNSIKTPLKEIEQLSDTLLQTESSSSDMLKLINNIKSSNTVALIMINQLINFIKDIENLSENINIDSLIEKNNIFSPFINADNIVSGIISVNYESINLFLSMADVLYERAKNNNTSYEFLLRNLYHHIIDTIYNKIHWLENFIDKHYFDEIYFIKKDINNSYKTFYCERLQHLLDLLKKCQLPTNDSTIKDIYLYILSNPDEQLKLKIISEMFFVNNTYLSNSFFAKTGVHFNEYTAMIKMLRAEYLFQNTQLKSYEISYKIGYRDINYFSKLFKKYCGQTPSEYRNKQYCDYQI